MRDVGNCAPLSEAIACFGETLQHDLHGRILGTHSATAAGAWSRSTLYRGSHLLDQLRRGTQLQSGSAGQDVVTRPS